MIRIAMMVLTLCTLCSTTPLYAQTDLYPVKMGSKWGFMDTAGQLVVQPMYDQIGRYEKGDYAYVQQGGYLGAVDRLGQLILECRYQQLAYIGQGLFSVAAGNRRQLINTQGMVLLDSLPATVELIGGGYLRYEQPDGIGVLHRARGIIMGPIQGTVSLLDNKWLLVTNPQGMQQIYDTLGQALLPQMVKNLERQGGLWWAQAGDLWGAYTLTGMQKVAHHWTSKERVVGSTYLLQDAQMTKTLYTYEGDTLLESIALEWAEPFEGTRIQALDLLGGRWVFDSLGQTLLYVKDCQKITYLGQPGCYSYQRGDQYGLYRMGMGVVTEPDFQFISNYNIAVAIIRQNDRWGVLNRDGDVVLQPAYEYKMILAFNQVRYKAPNKDLRIFNFDEDGQLLAEQKFANVRSLRIQGARRTFTAQDGNRGPRSTQTDPYQINDTLRWQRDNTVGEWGLMNTKTKIYKYSPQWSRVIVRPNEGISVVETAGENVRVKYNVGRIHVFLRKKYAVFNNTYGLPVTAPEFLGIRFSDFDAGLPLARCVFVNGRHGLMATNGRIVARDYGYIGQFIDGKARATQKGRLQVDLSGTKEDYPLERASQYFDGLLAILSRDRDYDSKFFDQLEATGQLYCKGAKWGYIDTLGQVAVNFQYEHVLPYYENHGRVCKGGKWSLLNEEGMPKLPFVYDSIQFLPNADQQLYLLQVYRPLHGLLDTTGKLSVPVAYQRIHQYAEDRVAVQDTLGGWGFLDRKGLAVTPLTYRDVRDYKEGRAAVREGYRWGYCDHQGQPLAKPSYLRCGDFSEGKAWVQISGIIRGYIDRQGKLLFKGRYSITKDFHQGRAAVKQSGQGWGIVDEQGQFILEPQKRYKKILPFNENGLAFVLVNKKYRLINRAGEWVGKRRYGSIRPFSEGIAVVRYQRLQGFHIGKREYRWTLIDTLGKAVMDQQYRKIYSFQEGRARFKDDAGKYGFLNRQGLPIIPAQYLKASDFRDNRAVVFKQYNKSGVIDTTGYEVLPVVYNRIEAHEYTRALVRSLGQGYYYLTENGHTTNQPLYAYAKPYYHGVALVCIGQKWGLINQQGLPIMLPQYRSAKNFEQGAAPVTVTDHYGITDQAGNVLLSTHYDYIAYVGNGLFRVEKAGKVGYMNQQGHWVWKLQ